MSIVATDIIDPANLNGEAGVNRASLTSRAADRKRTFVINKHVAAMNNTAAKTLAARIDFTPDDDYELRALGLFLNQPSGIAPTGMVITATLTAADGDDDYVLEETLTVSATVATGEVSARQGYDDVAGTRVMLHKGVAYRLAITSDSANSVDEVAACLVARLWRRAR